MHHELTLDYFLIFFLCAAQLKNLLLELFENSVLGQLNLVQNLSPCASVRQQFQHKIVDFFYPEQLALYDQLKGFYFDELIQYLINSRFFFLVEAKHTCLQLNLLLK